MIQNNLGIVYGKLSEVREKEGNLIKAIDGYKEALKIYTPERYPLDYAETQNNLGIAYRGLSEVRDKKGNLERAIEAYDEALRIYTKVKYPLDYDRAISNKVDAEQMLGK